MSEELSGNFGRAEHMAAKLFIPQDVMKAAQRVYYDRIYQLINDGRNPAVAAYHIIEQMEAVFIRQNYGPGVRKFWHDAIHRIHNANYPDDPIKLPYSEIYEKEESK